MLTSRDEIVAEISRIFLWENTEKALGALAVWYKKRFNIPVIGITGSVGKTSTKEMIAAALSPVYNVLKTAGNQNSNIGVPLKLFRLESGHEIAVIEMGISDFDEMAELADFVCPDTAVVTNIGAAHSSDLSPVKIITAEKSFRLPVISETVIHFMSILIMICCRLLQTKHGVMSVLNFYGISIF